MPISSRPKSTGSADKKATGHQTVEDTAIPMKARNALLMFGMLGAWFAGMASCVQAPEYPLEPILEFRSISNTSLVELGGDTLYLLFGFTDGDGDLGFEDSVNSVFVEDSRIPGFPLSYYIQEVVPLSNVQAISGTMSILYPPGFFACLGEDPLDTFRLEVRIKDRAGNESNLVSTPLLQIECQ